MKPARKAKNIQNLMEFMAMSRLAWTPKHIKAFERLGAEKVFTILKTYESDREAIETVQRFARRFKQTANEVELEDVSEAMKLAAIKSVMSE